MFNSRKPLIIWSFITLVVVLLIAIYVDRELLAFLQPYNTTEAKPSYWRVFEIARKMGEFHWVLLFGLVGVLAADGELSTPLKSLRNLKQRLPLLTRTRLAYLITTLTISGILPNILKVIFARPRPLHYLRTGLFELQWFKFSSYALASFPSGHSAVEVALLLSLMFMYPRFKKVGMVGLVLWPLCNALTLGHWASDVIAGAALGAACCCLARDYFADQGWSIK